MQQNVFQFNITVHDVECVEVLHAGENLFKYDKGFRLCKPLVVGNPELFDITF